MLRQAGTKVITERPPLHEVETKGKEEGNRMVSRYKGPVFTNRVGRMEVEEVKLRYEEGFKPRLERLEVHLKKLEREGVIQKDNPAEAVDCILNIAISKKKAQGCIRMNIDARPYNKGAKHTRYDVTTPQEARHKLKGAKIFSEVNMGNGFHQVPLHTDSQVIFQLHLGQHKVKRLFFPHQQLRQLPP
jgi:hypothetical protein